MENFTFVHHLASSVTVLDVVNWISLSYNSLKNECIQNCFCKAGFLVDGLDMNAQEECLD